MVAIDAESLEQRRVGLLGSRAVRADHPHQPLREHTQQAGVDDERRHVQILKAGDRTGGVVGMQRAEHEVTRQRRLHGDHRGFAIADLAEQDGVWVLSED